MPSTQELMGHGMPSGLAKALGQDYNAGLTATGSTQGTALALTSALSSFSTVAASTGAILPPASNKAPYVTYNGGANPLTVYPNGADTINGTTSFSVTNGKSAVFFQFDGGWIANLSS